ncbi:NAD(P)-binding protein [Trichoderma citrinoviride]|uniref:NAD(P)-binding protein n=1 Tax=Trichoderma citrinoviride TaxID=58853 RepID=A0A2T4B1R3_9HYPO|nr:NAD(P)-binding protein [Trichoderma citrinoviride]PTB63266.1 NAD(P)-binding protein [Trichoderma citrinoviride]
MPTFLRSYIPDKPMLLEKDINSLKDKVFIITGGSGGIGLELAKILYHANASRIYLLSRSRQSGDAAIAAITSSEPPPEMERRSAAATDAVRFIPLDLGDLNNVKEAAKLFLQLETRLDVIWHNAAVMLAPEGSVSNQGYELTFATNVFGPFLLQHFLTPIMLQTARGPATPKGSVRVCWAASGAAVAPPGDDGIVWDNWQLSSVDYGGFQGRTSRYMQSKAANVILAAEMAKVYPEIISCAFNPGAIKTDIARHAPWFLRVLHIFMSRPVRFGALTELYAGFSDEVAKKNGCFVVPFGQIGSTCSKVEAGISERNSGERLWALCDEHVREYY